MKKITDFIVNHCYVILILFIFLTIGSIYLARDVKINYDIAKYLPGSSSTRIGMDIMEKEFDSSTGTLNVMLEGLSKDEKNDAYSYLEKLDNVSDVEYDDSSLYNKDDYTLYILTVDASSDSKEAKVVYDSIQDHFKDKLVDTSGDISDENKDVLPFYIVVLAVVSALIILIIMSESYVEPFLFLISILIAVALNKGTNVIFPSVSNITNSIAAILQMALSMDYSIMLMNRYRQEKEHESDKVVAMKKALYNAFKAISSSSITTIVGLLALVFMSFTIGRDLGFVLAKGVLFSLLSIFTCLPGLVLLCDKLIIKTKKRSPIIKLNLLGKGSYKIRYVALVLFIAVFIGSYFLKGNLGILYTASGTDEIDKTFVLNNQMAIVYKNDDEKFISDYCNALEKDERIEEVLCYGNTINLSLRHDQLNGKLKDLGSDVEVEDYLLKIVYYHYYNSSEDNKMTLDQFINFIKNNVYDNDKMNDEIDQDMKNNINKLNNFTNYDLINKKRNAKDISSVLSMSEEQVNDLLVYYNSKNIKTKMSISEFVNFMNNSVITNKKYSGSVDDDAKKNLNKIANFTNKNKINKKISSKEMSKLFGIDEKMVDDLFIYYIMNSDVSSKMTINELVNFIYSDVLTDEQYKNMFDETMIDKLEMLRFFSDKEIVSKEMTPKEISDLLGVNEGLVRILFGGRQTMTPRQFIEIVMSMTDPNSEEYAEYQLLISVIESTLGNRRFTYEEMSQMFSINSDTLKQIYSLYLSKNYTLSPYEFVNFILNHKDDNLLKQQLDSSSISDLSFIRKIMISVNNDVKYSSKDLSNLLSIDKDSLNLIYSLYDLRNKDVVISFKDFISFLVDDVMNNSKYKDKFGIEEKNKLSTVKTIINDSLNNKKYKSDEVFNLLEPLSSDDLDKDLFDLVYIYYGSVNEYDEDWSLTIEEFVRYLNEVILKDKRFDHYIDKDMKNDIVDSKTTIKDAKELLVGEDYSRVVINTRLKPEAKETFDFISMIEDDVAKKNDIYIVGNSPMAYEMSKTFGDELNLITVLTMIFIFVVVIFTFKSVLIPIILVLLIQCAVFLTMGILSFGGSVYFISILIVQSILMGATIDYAIVYTSYYLESRSKNDIKQSIINAYNNSIHTILTSAFILIIVTLIVGYFASAVAAKICMTLSQGTMCSALLIILLLPAVLAACDKWIIKKGR